MKPTFATKLTIQPVNGQVDQWFYQHQHTGSMHGFSEIRSRSNVWKKHTHTEGHIYDYAHFLLQNLGLFVLCVCMYIYIYTRLGAKRCACKGLCTSVENITLMNFFFFFEMLYCAFAWMNEYIVQIISATDCDWFQDMVITHWKSAKKWPQKMDIQVPTGFCHFAYKQTASTWWNNHRFVHGKDNINTHDSCTFDQLIVNVCPVCMSNVLQTWTENFEQPKNDSIASESPKTSRVFRSIHLHYTAILVFFQRSFAWNLKNISPIVWYRYSIGHPYKISNILY